MARDFRIYGPALVRVTFSQSASNQILRNIDAELGLCSDPINVEYRFQTNDILIDEFGTNVPAEIMFNSAELTVTTPLVHYDEYLLEAVIRQTAGIPVENAGQQGYLGILPPTGTLLWNNAAWAVYGKNSFIKLEIRSKANRNNWVFPRAYVDMERRPTILPLGTEKSVALVTWRVLPVPVVSGIIYSGGGIIPSEIFSSGAVLWQREFTSG